MSTIFLSLGSNVGDRLQFLRGAVDALRTEPGIVIDAISPVYETQPIEDSPLVDGKPQDWFLNIVLRAQTSLASRDLLRVCQRLEQEAGRTRDVRYGPRTLDIDILLYDDEVIEFDDVQIPHPKMAERRFVLQPFSDLAPDVRVPFFQKTARELLNECDDTSIVRLLYEHLEPPNQSR